MTLGSPSLPRDRDGAPRVQGAASGNPVVSGLGIALRMAVLLWLVDLVRLLSSASDPAGTAAPLRWGPLWLGAGAALGFCVLLAGCAGFGLGAGLWLAGLPRPVEPPATVGGGVRGGVPWRLLDFLRPADPALQLLRSASIVALAPSLGVYALGSVLLSQRLILGMARPELAALAIFGLHLALSLVCLLVFFPLRGAASLLVRGLRQVPWLGERALSAPLHYALWLGSLLALALTVFVLRYAAQLAYLPWPAIRQLVLALFAALALTAALRRAPLLVRRGEAWLLCGITLAGVVCASALDAQHAYARRLAEQTFLSGRFGHGFLLAAFDRDRDGYMSIFGGGDCAPDDPTRHPGAIDVPGNRLDEDCDGQDLGARVLPKRGIYDFPVPESVPRRPPIVLITVDAFAATHMQALGGKREVTPNLDALAKKSVLFRDCFAQGPSTRLSFPSMFTSRWDSQIRQRLVGKHPYPIESSELMLAEVLRDAGYHTAAILPDPYFARSRWSGMTSGFTQVIESPFTERPALAHNGARVTAAATKVLEESRQAPLFLWVHYYDAHSPHEQPESSPVFGKSPRDVYDAELHFVDREVGALLAAIDQAFSGQALVFITGDHGIAFDAPRHEKFNYGYDLSTAVLHVPLIVHAPFLPARSLSGPVSTMDIMPTIVNLLRLPGLFPLEGVSLVPELFGGKRSRSPLLMHQMFLEERLWKNEDPLERASLRNDRYNLVHERKDGFFALYDYHSDYFETRDLSLDPAHEEALHDMKQDLLLLTYLTRPNAPVTPRDKRAKKPRTQPSEPRPGKAAEVEP